jgi:hypothetical protein
VDGCAGVLLVHVHEASSSPGVCGLKILVYEALSRGCAGEEAAAASRSPGGEALVAEGLIH